MVWFPFLPWTWPIQRDGWESAGRQPGKRGYEVQGARRWPIGATQDAVATRDCTVTAWLCPPFLKSLAIFEYFQNALSLSFSSNELSRQCLPTQHLTQHDVPWFLVLLPSGLSDLLVILTRQAFEWKWDEWWTAQMNEVCWDDDQQKPPMWGMLILPSLDALNCLNAYLNYNTLKQIRWLSSLSEHFQEPLVEHFVSEKNLQSIPFSWCPTSVYLRKMGILDHTVDLLLMNTTW